MVPQSTATAHLPISKRHRVDGHGGPPTRGPAISAGAGTTVLLAGRVPADAAADAADDESGVLLVQVPEGFLRQHELLDLLFHDYTPRSFVVGDGLRWPSVPKNEELLRKSSLIDSSWRFQRTRCEVLVPEPGRV